MRTKGGREGDAEKLWFTGTETEIHKIKDDSQMERQTNLDRRGPRPIPIICYFPDPPSFSLPTTFNKENKCCTTGRFRYGTPVLVYFVSSAVHYVFVNTDIQTLDFAPPPSLFPSTARKLDWRHTGRLRKKENLLTSDGGKGVGVEPNHTTARKNGSL
jgi:hypothetical protein